MNRHLPRPDTETDHWVPDKHGSTALHRAARAGSFDQLLRYLADGWNPNIRDHLGLTPMHEACLQGHDKVVYLLMAFSAEADATSAHYWSPLICAAGNGHSKIARALLAAGADVNGTTAEGFSAIHMAAAKGLTDIVRLLCAAGCRLDIKTKDGQTALDMARRAENNDCVQLLEAATQRERIDLDARKIVEEERLLHRGNESTFDERRRLKLRVDELRLQLKDAEKQIRRLQRPKLIDTMTTSASLPENLHIAAAGGGGGGVGGTTATSITMTSPIRRRRTLPLRATKSPGKAMSPLAAAPSPVKSLHPLLQHRRLSTSLPNGMMNAGDVPSSSSKQRGTTCAGLPLNDGDGDVRVTMTDLHEQSLRSPLSCASILKLRKRLASQEAPS